MQTHEDRDHGVTRSTTKVLMTAFVVELVVGGPGFWQISGLSIRRTLIAVITVWLLALCALGRCRLRGGHLLLLVSTALFLVTWILLIPSLYDSGRLNDAIQEGFPLAMIFPAILVHAYYLDNPDAWDFVRKACALSLATVAALALAIWALGTFVVDDPLLIVVAATNFFTWGNGDLEPSLYIQRMPDGFFRVMWITSVLFMTGLIYCLRTGNILGLLLFVLALFVSYTRALWLAATIGVFVAQLLGQPGKSSIKVRSIHLVFVILAACAFVGFDLMGDSESSALQAVWNRLATIFSDESAEDRVGQVLPLIDAWQSTPLFGSGMGSAAAASRSDVAPYLYELTYLALLMKLGVVGFSMVTVLIAALLLHKPSSGLRPVHIDACIVSFLLASGTNPYLLNLVGLGLLCFLFIERDLYRPVRRQRRSSPPNRAATDMRPSVQRDLSHPHFAGESNQT